MRHLDQLHLEIDFGDSRMLRGLLAADSCKSASGKSKR
jgi:hypothetical protein